MSLERKNSNRDEQFASTPAGTAFYVATVLAAVAVMRFGWSRGPIELAISVAVAASFLFGMIYLGRAVAKRRARKFD